MTGPASTSPLLTASLPDVATELARLLATEGLDALAQQVATLPVVDRCRCEDSFCATFYTATPPKGAWGPGHKTIPLLDANGRMVNVDVLNGAIVAVEVLDRDELRDRLRELFP